MADEKKVYTPPTEPLVVQLPQEPIEDILKMFSGRITPRTFAAAKRLQAKPGTVKVPVHLLRKLWELTGGWKEIELANSGYVDNRYVKHQFPARAMGPEYSRYFERTVPGQEKVKVSERQKERVPWRTGAWGTNLGELEVLVVSTTSGPYGFLRWRGWVVGKIHYKSEGSQDKGWLTPARASEFRLGLCHRLSEPEADGWGFLTAEEVAKA